MIELQEGTSCHAHLLSLIWLILVRLESMNRGLAVRVDAQIDRQWKHCQCTGDCLELSRIHSGSAFDIRAVQSCSPDVRNLHKPLVGRDAVEVVVKPLICHSDGPCRGASDLFFLFFN